MRFEQIDSPDASRAGICPGGQERMGLVGETRWHYTDNLERQTIER